MALEAPSPHPAKLLIGFTLRVYFIMSAVAAGLAIANLSLNGIVVSDAARRGLILTYAVIAVASLAATRLSLPWAIRAMVPLLLAALAVIGSTGLTVGWGLRTPGLYFLGVMCCLTCAVSSRWHGLAISAGALALVAVLAGAEHAGAVPSLLMPAVAPLASRVLVLVLSIVVGAAAGTLLARLVRAYVSEASEREQRFRALLGLATTAYWEADAELRVTHVSGRNRASEFANVDIGPPVVPWDMPGLSVDAESTAQLRAALLARAPLRDVPLRWQRAGREPIWLLISGEPRFDWSGQLTGYWGVARDTSAEHHARAALLDTELRYRDLFRQTPTPMLLHSDGHIVDANDAAAAMLGVADVRALSQRHLLEFYDEPDRSLVRERIRNLATITVGESLPLASYAMRADDGRQLLIRSTGVRADFGGRPAMLSIYIDETVQRDAASALLRSEALLRQVVSVSPDVITLTDLNTGHYEMVNDSFERVTGYAAADVLGRTAEEIGIWGDREDRQRLVSALRSHGAVKDMVVGFVHRNGHRLPMLVSASRFDREGKPYLVINARDVSEANRERLEREAIMANLSVGLAHTRDRRFVLVNPRFEQMFGWPPGQLLGQLTQALWASSEGDYLDIAEQVLQALRQGLPVDIERPAKRFDGSTFLVRVRAKAIDPQRPSSGGTIWVTEDVTAQRQAESDLARARDEAEAANHAKSAFLANTSHEIRTPLNGLVGLARMARQPDLAPARLRQYLEQIGDSAETLSMIISDILDLSKIEAGRLQVEQAPFDVQALLDSLHHAYAALADHHDLVFTLHVDSALPPWVLGDALRVRQVLVNFLHNALKFTARGEVRLSVRALADERWRFEVSDTGLGIDAATQARLFKPFTQADVSITRRFGGTGLGLSICRELATLMGGSVGLQSSLGEGSCFHVELPLPQVQPEMTPSGLMALDADLLHGARALLVEDNAVNMMIAVAQLEQWGLVVTEAEDGARALALLARQAPLAFDVVLMDVQMPGMDGYEATRRLRQRWSAQALPVIALTAAALVSEREQALAAGMTDFVTKPIEPQRLQQALRVALAGRSG